MVAGKMKNCQTCGKIFVAVHGARLCPDCREKEEKMESVVINYVRDNPGVKIPKVMEDTGASESLIKRLIREGRFEDAGLSFKYPCERCGEAIDTGKFCRKCAAEMAAAFGERGAKLSAALEAKQAKKGAGIYSKDL